MGAAIQTGVGTVEYAWADAYSGAARSMVVTNPQVERKQARVCGPADRSVARVAGLFVAVHYALDREGMDHVTAPWRTSEPDLLAFADRRSVRSAFARARIRHLSLLETLAAAGVG